MSLHKSVEINSIGRDFVVGDLHGMYTELIASLSNIDFNPDQDRLFSVGDLIDRGPDSLKCLELLDKPWFYAIQGNHERFMIDSLVHNLEMPYSSWIANGGAWTLDTPEPVLQKWALRLSQLPVTIQVQLSKELPVGIVHAEFPLDNWDNRLNYTEINDPVITAMLWSRSQIKNKTIRKIEGVKTIYLGHTPTDEIVFLGNSHFIDLGCYTTKQLAIIQIN